MTTNYHDIERSKEALACLEELVSVCKKYGFSAFLLERATGNDEADHDWLRQAIEIVKR